jgi:hypothetical protein
VMKTSSQIAVCAYPVCTRSYHLNKPVNPTPAGGGRVVAVAGLLSCGQLISAPPHPSRLSSTCTLLGTRDAVGKAQLVFRDRHVHEEVDGRDVAFAPCSARRFRGNGTAHA